MGEKTEQPSSKKLRDARREGRAAISADLSVALAWMVVGGTVALVARIAADPLMAYLKQLLIDAVRVMTLQDALMFTRNALLVSCSWIMALCLLAAVVTVTVGFLQTAGAMSMEKLAPDLSHLNPVENLKRIFSARSLVTLVTSLVKVAVVVCAAYSVGTDVVASLANYGSVTPRAAIDHLAAPIARLLMLAGLGLLALSVLDVLLQRRLFIKDLMQDKDEVKRDYKEMEGDPIVKGAREAISRELIEEPVREGVSRANVIVVNPTHLSVGIRYTPDGDTPIPIVTVKAKDGRALEVRRLAAEAQLPIIEWVPLARRLYGEVPVNETIPDDLFEAVADVLAWVQRQRQGDPTPWRPGAQL